MAGFPSPRSIRESGKSAHSAEPAGEGEHHQKNEESQQKRPNNFAAFHGYILAPGREIFKTPR